MSNDNDNSLVVMVMCAQRKNCSSYQEVIERWIEPKFGMIANIFIFLFLYGLSVSWQKGEQVFFTLFFKYAQIMKFWKVKRSNIRYWMSHSCLVDVLDCLVMRDYFDVR